MSRADLVADLATALHDALAIFGYEGEASFDDDVRESRDTPANAQTQLSRLLDIAVLDFSRYRQRHMRGQITLQAGTDLYPAPADLYHYNASDWGRAAQLHPWDYPRLLRQRMRVEMVDVGPGCRSLLLDPCPTIGHIEAFGSTFAFRYDARHVIADEAAETTVRTEDRDLLLLRGQVEALREISTRDAWKPAKMRDGMNASPRNQTMAALYEKFLGEWKASINGVCA